MNKIKVNDKVIILSGKDKGKIGVVTKLLNDKVYGYKKVVVEGINLFKKHTKSNPNKNKVGGIVSIEKPISYSNVALFCANIGKKSKVFFKISEDEKKLRFFKLTKEVVN